MKTEKGEIILFGPLLLVRGYADSLDLYHGLLAFFGTMRPVKTNKLARKYPETTLADVRQVIDLFNDRAKRARRDAKRVRDALDGWAAFVKAHGAMTGSGTTPATAVYPENDRLWTHELRRLAINLSVERDTRPEDKTLAGAFVDSATALPGRVADVVTGGASGAADAADAVVDVASTIIDKAGDALDTLGDVASDAGDKLVDIAKDAASFAKNKLPVLPDPGRWMRDLFGDIKWPLIVGAGIVGGIVLLPYLSTRKGPS